MAPANTPGQPSGTPVVVTFNMPGQTATTPITVTPIVFGRDVTGFAKIKDKVALNDKAWAWPELEGRRNLSDHIVLLPRGDSWQLSLMVAHKMMIGSLDDGGATFREALYRAMKHMNKKMWAPESEHETYKIASYALMVWAYSPTTLHFSNRFSPKLAAHVTWTTSGVAMRKWWIDSRRLQPICAAASRPRM